MEYIRDPQNRSGMEEPDWIDEVEAEARANYGDEEIDLRLRAAEEAVIPAVGTGDLPPGYNPEADPLVHRRRAVARHIVFIALAGIGTAAAAKGIHSYKQRNK